MDIGFKLAKQMHDPFSYPRPAGGTPTEKSPISKAIDFLEFNSFFILNENRGRSECRFKDCIICRHQRILLFIHT